jgi:hypothetical protein
MDFFIPEQKTKKIKDFKRKSIVLSLTSGVAGFPYYVMISLVFNGPGLLESSKPPKLNKGCLFEYEYN